MRVLEQHNKCPARPSRIDPKAILGVGLAGYLAAAVLPVDVLAVLCSRNGSDSSTFLFVGWIYRRAFEILGIGDAGWQ